MLGMRHTKPKCGDCLNCNTESYGKPVCYEQERRDEKKVAVEISERSNRAERCHHFKLGRLQVPDILARCRKVR